MLTTDQPARAELRAGVAAGCCAQRALPELEPHPVVTRQGAAVPAVQADAAFKHLGGGLCTLAFRARGTFSSEMGKLPLGAQAKTKSELQVRGGRPREILRAGEGDIGQWPGAPSATAGGRVPPPTVVLLSDTLLSDRVSGFSIQIAQCRAITSRASARTAEEGGGGDPQPSPGALRGALGK